MSADSLRGKAAQALVDVLHVRLSIHPPQSVANCPLPSLFQFAAPNQSQLGFGFSTPSLTAAEEVPERFVPSL